MEPASQTRCEKCLAENVIFGVNGYDCRCNFASIRQHTLECIKQQQFANVPATEVLADGQSYGTAFCTALSARRASARAPAY
jgi:hypothetical protein